MKKLLALICSEAFQERIRKDLSEKAKAKAGRDNSKKQVSTSFERHN